VPKISISYCQKNKRAVSQRATRLLLLTGFANASKKDNEKTVAHQG
jgi:hypothetical protein